VNAVHSRVEDRNEAVLGVCEVIGSTMKKLSEWGIQVKIAVGEDRVSWSWSSGESEMLTP
jgi:hypothetical protein